MQILTAQQARDARDALNLSQRRVAIDAAVSRPMLSLFEQQRAIPEDAFLTTLRDFFESHGFEFDDLDNDEPSAEPTPAADPFPDAKVRDGFLYPKGVSVEEVDAALEEVEGIDAQIAELLSKRVEHAPLSLSGRATDESQEDQRRLLALMARAYCLVRIVQGRETVSPCPVAAADLPVGGETDDQRGWLSQVFGDVFGFADPDDDPNAPA